MGVAHTGHSHTTQEGILEMKKFVVYEVFLHPTDPDEIVTEPVEDFTSLDKAEQYVKDNPQRQLVVGEKLGLADDFLEDMPETFYPMDWLNDRD